MRVVFMGSPEFALSSLDAVHEAFDVVGVYCQADKPAGRGQRLCAPPVKTRALELGLPVFQPKRLSQKGELERLTELNPDCIVVVAYGKMIKRNVIDLPRLGIVNVHSSLLPRWRGAAPIQGAILAGDAETGVTTMRIVEELDAGDMLLQERLPIGPEDTAGTLHDKLSEMGATLIVKTLEQLEAGSLKGEPQDDSKATFIRKLKKSQQWLDCSKPAKELDRIVRAFSPWPGSSVETIDGERLKVLKARPDEQLSHSQGQIDEHDGRLVLGTVEGVLELQELQREGKRATDAAGFLNGWRGQNKSFPIAIKSPPADDEGER